MNGWNKRGSRLLSLPFPPTEPCPRLSASEIWDCQDASFYNLSYWVLSATTLPDTTIPIATIRAGGRTKPFWMCKYKTSTPVWHSGIWSTSEDWTLPGTTDAPDVHHPSRRGAAPQHWLLHPGGAVLPLLLGTTHTPLAECQEELMAILRWILLLSRRRKVCLLVTMFVNHFRNRSIMFNKGISCVYEWFPTQEQQRLFLQLCLRSLHMLKMEWTETLCKSPTSQGKWTTELN